MKNLLLTLAFLFVCTFSFANSYNADEIAEQITAEELVIEKMYSSASYAEMLSITTVQFSEDFLQCHVTIKGTINGKKVDIDITFTSDSGSCIKDTVALLKELAAEN